MNPSLPGFNIAGLLTRSARQTPDAPALIHGDETLSYAALAERVSRLAGGLRSLGLTPGDRVGIVQRNGPRLVESLLAALHGGFVAVPINARSTPYELKDIASDSMPRVWLHGPEYVEHIDGLDAIRVGVGHREGEHEFDQLLVRSTAAAAAEVAADDPAWLFYTSGTTGRMKGATLTHRNLLSMTQSFLSDIRDYGPGAGVVHAAPLTHGSGLYALPPLARGVRQVITTSASFDPDELLDAIERHRLSGVAFLAPTMLNRVAESQRERPRDIGTLLDIVYGGAPMYRDDIERALDVLGGVLTQIYGQAEAPVTISRLTAAEHVRALESDPDLLVSAGRPYTVVDVRVDDGSGQPVADGIGEIVVRGDVVMKGYWENPEATATAFAGGWLHTGDVGRVDERGYVFMMDRNKDVIISGGANIYPREVEEVLLLHPAVREAAVVGAPDAEWGERVVAVLSLTPDAERDGVDFDDLTTQIVSHCREKLSGYKIPRQIELSSDLPKSAYGKVLKREIRESYWRGHDRRI